MLTRAKMYVIRNTKRSKNQEDFKMWVRSSKWRTLALHPLNIFILHSSPESQGNILCSCVHHITRIVWKVPRLSLNTLVHLHVTRTNSKCYTPYGGGGNLLLLSTLGLSDLLRDLCLLTWPLFWFFVNLTTVGCNSWAGLTLTVAATEAMSNDYLCSCARLVKTHSLNWTTFSYRTCTSFLLKKLTSWN